MTFSSIAFVIRSASGTAEATSREVGAVKLGADVRTSTMMFVGYHGLSLLSALLVGPISSVDAIARVIMSPRPRTYEDDPCCFRSRRSHQP